MDDQAITLRKFVELASYGVDGIFKRCGSIQPMFHAVERSGESFVFDADLRNKDLMCVLATAAFKAHDVVRYVFINEAWTVVAHSQNEIDEAMRLGASRHPARQEMVMFSAEDQAEGILVASRAIIRPAKGRATLGPLEIAPAGVTEGRFVGLLPRHGTAH